MTTTIRSPLFIFGYPRSGTTLLRSILSAHPDIHLANEPDLFPSLLLSGFDIYDRLTLNDRIRFMEAYRKCPGGSGKRHLKTLPAGRSEEFIDLKSDPTFREGYEFLLPKPPDAKVWGAKTLSLVFYLKRVFALYPNAICLSLIRDPRAALLSLYRKRHLRGAEVKPPFTRRAIAFFARESLLWTEWVSAATRARRLWGDPFVCQLRFEDFVSAPAKFLHEICATIGVPFDPAMLDRLRRRSDSVATPDLAHAHHRLTKDIDPQRARAGDELPPWASHVIERFAGKTMAELGYEFTQARPGVFQRLILTLGLRLKAQTVRHSVDCELKRRLATVHAV